jgi:hypothetical protein
VGALLEQGPPILGDSNFGARGPQMLAALA